MLEGGVATIIHCRECREILRLQGTPSAGSQSNWSLAGERPPITALNTAQTHIHVGSELELAEASES